MKKPHQKRYASDVDEWALLMRTIENAKQSALRNCLSTPPKLHDSAGVRLEVLRLLPSFCLAIMREMRDRLKVAQLTEAQKEQALQHGIAAIWNLAADLHAWLGRTPFASLEGRPAWKRSLQREALLLELQHGGHRREDDAIRAAGLARATGKRRIAELVALGLIQGRRFRARLPGEFT